MEPKIEIYPRTPEDHHSLCNELKISVGKKRINVIPANLIEDQSDRNIDSLIAFAGGTHEGVEAFLTAIKTFNAHIFVDGRHKGNDKGKKSHFQRKVNV